MFIPTPDILIEILKIDATQYFAPGKRIDSENGADKRFINRQQKAFREKFQGGKLTEEFCNKQMLKFVKRFDEMARPLLEVRDKARATGNWRHLTMIANGLASGDIAGGLIRHRVNWKTLIEFRKFEIISWSLRTDLFKRVGIDWNFSRRKTHPIFESRTFKAFSTPSAIEAWRTAPYASLHPCEFISLGYFIQKTTRQSHLLTNISMQKTPAQVKTVFIDEYLLRNSQWGDKSEMWGATPVDRIKTFTERDTTPFIDTFVQYIMLIDNRDHPKISNMEDEYREAVNRCVRSNLFLIAVFCCLSIRMRQDWGIWSEIADIHQFSYDDMLRDFRDFQEREAQARLPFA